MSNTDVKKKPKPGVKDAAHTAGKVVFSLIPGIGGAAAEIFSTVIVPPLTKRRDEWIESIANGLKELEEKDEGFKIEELANNDMFITTVMHASQVAIRNHQEEKLEALKNAVLNAASPNAPEEDIQLMFLHFIDTLTPWHIRILTFFEDPKGWAEKYNVKLPDLEFGSPSHALLHAFPELRSYSDFVDQVVKDLYAGGLMSIESLKTTMPKQGIFASRTTDFGSQFIQFITSPDLSP